MGKAPKEMQNKSMVLISGAPKKFPPRYQEKKGTSHRANARRDSV
jgi:hypothetical protein